MKKKLFLFISCFLLVGTAFLPAQTAVEIEELLKKEALSNEQAARFVLKAADLQDLSNLDGFPDQSDAFRYSVERRWLPRNAVGGAEASLDGVSLLIMQSFGIKGGFLYSLFKNPHYAYREMVYQDIIQGRADPDMAVSGELLLFLINRVVSRLEDGSISNTPVPSYRALAAETQGAQVSDATESGLTWQEPEQAPSPEQIAKQQALVEEINSQLESHAVADASARVTSAGITISLSNIQFTANSTELPAAEKRKLQEIASILKTIPARKILVAGHTALAGTPQDRLKTSQERAAAVASYLISLGARNVDEIFVQGYGAERPIADNSTPQGMARNRRVEIIILENQ